jgi:hypothetical protein
MSFGYLKQYRTAERTARLTLASLPGVGAEHPTLIVKFAGRGNDAFVNARAKAAFVHGVQASSASRVNDEILASILAETVIVGWESMPEDDPDHAGCIRSTPFSTSACLEFLLALAVDRPTTYEWILSQVTDEKVFLIGIAPPKVHAEDLGKE